jgi:hypothetical protein
MKFRGEVHWYETVESDNEEDARLQLLDQLNHVIFHERLQVEQIPDGP